MECKSGNGQVWIGATAGFHREKPAKPRGMNQIWANWKAGEVEGGRSAGCLARNPQAGYSASVNVTVMFDLTTMGLPFSRKG
jgi:hypothetical protein